MKTIEELAKDNREQYPAMCGYVAEQSFLDGARAALEMAAERAKVRVKGGSKDYTDDEYVNDWDFGQETVTVDKQSILDLLK